MAVKVKICGITRPEDGLAAAKMGADMLGFIFAKSPRRVEPGVAAEIISQLPESVEKVGVFVEEPAERVADIATRCGLTLVQLHGEESPAYCREFSVKVVKSFRVKGTRMPPGISRYRGVDAGGETGPFDYQTR